jgi:hypothetical protein
MVARAGRGIHAVARAHHALPGLQRLCHLRLDAALAGELAFLLRDDDLEALLLRRQRLRSVFTMSFTT